MVSLTRIPNFSACALFAMTVRAVVMGVSARDAVEAAGAAINYDVKSVVQRDGDRSGEIPLLHDICRLPFPQLCTWPSNMVLLSRATKEDNKMRFDAVSLKMRSWR